MESRYDYRDPGTDAAYCDGLAPDPDDTPLPGDVPWPVTSAESQEFIDTGAVSDDEPLEPFRCYYCHAPTVEPDYCSAHCAAIAAHDSEDDR